MTLLDIVKEKEIEVPKQKGRKLNLDLVKDIAILFVFSIHFYLHTDFYSTKMNGSLMYIMSIFRVLFITCVPLFMITTGALMNKKKLTKEHYKKISKVLIIYVLASIASILYKKFYLNTEFTFIWAIKSIFDYTANNYAWYIEMYIGLYLLIPFINMIYNGCENKNQKILLISIFTFLTIAPTALNLKWILIPYSWTFLYPVTYYLIGAFFSEYKINASKLLNVILLILFTIIFGTLNFVVRYGKNFAWGNYADYYGFEAFIISVLIFNFLINLNLDNLKEIIKKVLIKISDLSLGMYLVSYIFDTTFYKILNENKSGMEEKIKYFIIVVPLVFISSMILSQVMVWIKDILEKGISKLKRT